MSDRLCYFESNTGTVALSLPFDYRQAVEDWSTLRKTMIRQVPDEFTRDEWAYLVTFLDTGNLLQPFLDSFGTPVAEPSAPPRLQYRPRGLIAVWLPNNVSLLGPLTLVLLSLTGQPIRLKPGSSAEDLAGAFLRYAVANLPPGDLRDHLANRVETAELARDDPRQAELARLARVRIVFGTDAAAEAIHRLPHPLDSIGISFVDRASEAWLEAGAVTDAVLTTLIKVFAIYGQAGCTSPKRVILLNSSREQADDLRDRLVALWPGILGQEPAMHTASGNILAEQLSRALGWSPKLAPRNAALLASGSRELPGFESSMALRIQSATPEQALADLPPNIQTIGYALETPNDPAWLALLARSRVLRFVPLGQMHHFGSTWDGQDFWRLCFEGMEIRS
jgi:hypothetical protein